MRKLKMIILMLAVLGTQACTKEAAGDVAETSERVCVTMDCIPLRDAVKSAFTLEEEEVRNWNLFVYFGGRLEKQLYSEGPVEVELTVGQSYDLYALANVGMVAAPGSDAELAALECMIGGVSSFNSSGLPMAGSRADFVPGSSSSLSIPMERLVSRYDFLLDLTGMEYSSFDVESVRVRQSALTVKPFSAGSAASAVGDCDYASPSDLSALRNGHSVSFYMLENRRGNLLPDNADQWQKVPDRIPSESGLCTYLEVSGSWTAPGMSADVTYRMFLGRDNHSDFNVDRNTTNTLTLALSDEGVGRESWKVSRTNLSDIRVLRFGSRTKTAFKQQGYDSVPVICEPSGVVYGLTSDAAALTAARADWYLAGDTLYFRSLDGSSQDMQVPFRLSSWDDAVRDTLEVTFRRRDPEFLHWDYSVPEITVAYPRIPADGSAVSPTVSYRQQRFACYDDLSRVPDSELSGTVELSATAGEAFIKEVSGTLAAGTSLVRTLGSPATASVGASHLGTTLTDVREVAAVTLSCEVNGVVGQGNANVLQQANTRTFRNESGEEKTDHTMTLTDPGYSSASSPFPAAGGTVTVCALGGCTVRPFTYRTYTYASGSVEAADYDYESPRRSPYYGVVSVYDGNSGMVSLRRLRSEKVNGDGYNYFEVTIHPNTTSSPRSVRLTVDRVGVFERGQVTLQIFQAGERNLTGVSVSPSSLDLVLGGSSSVRVYAHYSDGSTEDVTASAALSSDSQGVSVSSAGAVSASGLGPATLTASYSGLSAQCPVTVSRPPLQGIRLSAASVMTRTGEISSATLYPVPSEALLGDVRDYSISAPDGTLYQGIGLEDNLDNSFTFSIRGRSVSGSQTVTISGGGFTATLTHTNHALVTSIGSASGRGIPTVRNVVLRPGSSTDHFTLAVVPVSDAGQWLEQGYDDIVVRVMADALSGGGRMDITDRFSVTKSYTPAAYQVDDAGVMYFVFRPSPAYGSYSVNPLTFTNVQVVFTSREKAVSYGYPFLTTVQTYYR